MVCTTRFVMGTEIECLTTVPDHPETNELAVAQLLNLLSRVTPSLPATSGVFTCYGRVYCDVGHVELAAVECDSPYLLSTVVEQLQAVIATAVEQLAREGIKLVLANNNYSGVLQENSPVWGDHENYLTEVHPAEFTQEILPFLVTRIYGGAGAIFYPTGDYLAGARPTSMELAAGGGTTEARAIHSTAREEHHMGGCGRRYRYHGILADGHRSHYNLVLLYGCTTLAIKAALFDTQLRAEIGQIHNEFATDDWVGTLKELNVLAAPGAPLKIHPLVIRTQTAYLAGARRFAASLNPAPTWIGLVLEEWQKTLDAFERLDRPWLSARLDAFAKYEFFSAVLQQMGLDWKQLPRHPDAFYELALLDQNYHEFCNPNSVFNRLERAGVLQHRVHDRVLPGGEAEPYVPDTATRARVRSRFIRDNRDRSQFVVDWSWIHDNASQRRQFLSHPYARRYSRWKTHAEDGYTAMLSIEESLMMAGRQYDRGAYEDTRRRVVRLEQMCRLSGIPVPATLHRYAAFVLARRGDDDSLRRLDAIYGASTTASLTSAVDYCCALRLLDLPPDLQRMQPWIDRGKSCIASNRQDAESSLAVQFREHVAYAQLRNGQLQQAQETLQPAVERIPRLGPAVSGRVLATLGEINRMLGNRDRGKELLLQANTLQSGQAHYGYLADFIYPCLAKCEVTDDRRASWLKMAQDIQLRSANKVGYAVSLVLEARHPGTPQRAETIRTAVSELRPQFPILVRSPIVTKILDQWSDWTSGADREGDEYWGL